MDGRVRGEVRCLQANQSSRPVAEQTAHRPSNGVRGLRDLPEIAVMPSLTGPKGVAVEPVSRIESPFPTGRASGGFLPVGLPRSRRDTPPLPRICMNRRRFLKRLAVGTGGVLGLGAAGYGYGRFESTWLHVIEYTVAVPRLPPPFCGMRVALLTDPHHGRFNSLEYIASVVDLTATL